MIPVFLSSDNNYAPFVATTIASVCDNTKSFINFCILDGGISSESKAKINSLKNVYKNFSIEYIKIDTERYFYSFKENGHIKLPTYFRFLIADLKPQLKKFIYLDVDLIVHDDIKMLYDQLLDDCIIGAVKDICVNSETGFEHKNNLGLLQSSVYFNAGVLLIDAEKWRKENITQKLFEQELEYRNKIIWLDQDILNIVFQRNYKILDDKYNWATKKESPQNIVIRHYITQDKPWQISSELCTGYYEYCKYFWEYAIKTDFYEYLVENTLYKNPYILKIKKLYRKGLFFNV